MTVPRQVFFVYRGPSQLLWRVQFRGADGLVRDVFPGKLGFFRWFSAAQVASALQTAYDDGRWQAKPLV